MKVHTLLTDKESLQLMSLSDLAKDLAKVRNLDMRVAWGSSSIENIPRSREIGRWLVELVRRWSLLLGIGSLPRVATGFVFHIYDALVILLGYLPLVLGSSFVPRYIIYRSTTLYPE